jgi:hypothetical protein
LSSIVFKALLAAAAVLVLVFVAGVTGLLFILWPTGLGDRTLNVSPKTLASLRELRSERKFGEDFINHYPGAPNEVVRAVAQAAVDAVLEDLIRELPSRPRRSFVLNRIKVALAAFQPTDSEERDRVLWYWERVLDATGIENSGELFNVWRYGFPYGWIRRA